MLLSSCGQVVSNACPPLINYSASFQAKAADQLDRLPEGSPVVVLVTDYGKQRDAIRACGGVK
jgi:hypothetical protein